MEDVEPPLYKISEFEINKDLVRPHQLASIGGNRTVFDQRLGPNGFTNRGPRRFRIADLGGLIEDLRHNKLLYLVTIPRQWNNQDNVNTWETHHGKIQGVNMQANGGFIGTFQNPTSLYPYSTQARKEIKNSQGKGWQAQKPEHHHPVVIYGCLRRLQR